MLLPLRCSYPATADTVPRLPRTCPRQSSELSFLAWRINEHLMRWAMQKFKRFRGKYARAADWLQKVDVRASGGRLRLTIVMKCEGLDAGHD